MPVQRGFNFNSVPVAKVGRTKFNMSHSVKGGFPQGRMIPLLCQEVVPGDYWKVKAFTLQRYFALIAPMMQQSDVHMDFFYVPSRLLHKDFADFRTGGEDGKQAPTCPQVNLGALFYYEAQYFVPGSTLNYLGIPGPLKLQSGQWVFDDSLSIDMDHLERYPTIDLKPINAYIMIWNEYVRDETLQPKLPLFDESKVYTPDEMNTLIEEATGGDYNLDWLLLHPYHRAWPKDYFTTAQPDPQRGNAVGVPFAQSSDFVLHNPKVNLGLGEDESLDVVGDGSRVNGFEATWGNDGPLTDDYDPTKETTLGASYSKDPTDLIVKQRGFESIYGVADLSNLSTVSIIGLRTAFAIQSILEKLNISGGRIQEFTLAMFNEWVPDNRIQKPIRLSSSMIPVSVSEVETNAEAGGLVVGDLAGKAKSTGGFRPFKLKVVEDGYIIGLISIMPKPAYLQGLSRMWTRFDRWDMYMPQTQFIGEQAIKNKEILVDWSGSDDWNNKDFGYQARFSDMKFNPDRVVGDMQTSLAYWHQARIFDQRPGLNADFIECNPSTRPFAVSDSDYQNVVGEVYFNMVASRKMARYATPKLT